MYNLHNYYMDCVSDKHLMNIMYKRLLQTLGPY